MRKTSAFSMLFAVLALLMVYFSGPGTKHGWWPWYVGMVLAGGALVIGLGAALGSAVALAAHASPKLRMQRWWLPLISLVLGIAAAAGPLMLVMKARSVPSIHDITTDTADPPAFVALLEARNAAPNGSAYKPEIAALQTSGYQDIAPKVLGMSPEDAMQRTLDIARSMGWVVVASDSAAGRVEATATTRWFGFKDDIVIRIRPSAGGSRVDMRSMSRVGRSDAGANAARIRAFMAQLSDQ